ncbi:MAG: copper chaperone PCu(A)C [Gammaproteobacteria bacterium]
MRYAHDGQYRVRATLLALAFFLAACGPQSEERAARVEDPWVRLAPPNAGMMAGYLVLENPGARQLELVAVSSPDFASVEVHRTEIVDGVARMIAEPALTIPPGGRAVFEPGARHLMLHGPARSFGEDEQVNLEFRFADGTQLAFAAPVRRGPQAADHQHDH